MTNEERFREVYTRKLVEAVQTRPDMYTWPAAEASDVVERMITALKKGSAIVSPVVKAAAKECGVVPQTHQNIRDYLLGKLEVINE